MIELDWGISEVFQINITKISSNVPLGNNLDLSLWDSITIYLGPSVQLLYLYWLCIRDTLVLHFTLDFLRLREGEASLIVNFEDFLDGGDVRSCTEVQTEIVLHGCTHDGSGWTLHGVSKTRVNDVLLGCTLKLSWDGQLNCDNTFIYSQNNSAHQTAMLNCLEKTYTFFLLFLSDEMI